MHSEEAELHLMTFTVGIYSGILGSPNDTITVGKSFVFMESTRKVPTPYNPRKEALELPKMHNRRNTINLFDILKIIISQSSGRH